MSNPSEREFNMAAPLHAENARTCPDCGGETAVTDSRPTVVHGFSTTKRRRQCSECDTRFTTVETTFRSLNSAVGLRKRLFVVRASLQGLLNEVNRVKLPEDAQ